ncbi:hypothetical protein [Flavobacterium sp.]
MDDDGYSAGLRPTISYNIPSGLLDDDGYSAGLRPTLSNNIPSELS